MNPRIAFAVALGFAGLIASVARADDAPVAPWVKAETIAHTANDAIASSGILGIKPYVADLEDALANASAAIAQAASGSGGVIVLTDGPADSLMALMSAATDNKSAQAIPNPYPAIALFLGSYYNEIGKPEDALRVLNEGLAATSELGEHRPILLSERGAALQVLKRWPDALASYDEGLKIADLDPATHALLLRGRGFALTELDRLDDAEAAYRESLTFEPGNKRAQSELEYIDKLRLGGGKAPAGITTVQPLANPPPPAPAQNPSGP